MLRRIRLGSARRGDDAGVATSILVMGMALILAAGFLGFGRIAHASNLRTRAQVGADAAALGTLAPLRDLMVSMLMQGMLPDAAGYWGVGDPAEAAAEPFADKNNTRVTTARLSGIAGDTALVEVATKDCQLKKEYELTAKEKADLAHHRNLCTDTSGKKGIGRFGTARSIARVIPPSCTITPIPGIGGEYTITCDGLLVWNGFGPAAGRDLITRLFRIRLVDKEDPVDYTGVPVAFPIGPGGVANEANRQTGKELAAEAGWTGAEWDCLDQLWQHESGWNELAHNPSSGAHGIPQSLPASKMAVYGPDYLTNPVVQIKWGINYIQGRYGTPCNAWAQWQSRSPHWY